jgi:hypothetical protein
MITPNYNSISYANPKNIILNLNLRLTLDDSIPIITPIFEKPLVHVRAAFIWVVV